MFISSFQPVVSVLFQSHHKPREGPFEMNDVFAIINAVPAISLMAYGFFNNGLVPGLCFGAVSRWGFPITVSWLLEVLPLSALKSIRNLLSIWSYAYVVKWQKIFVVLVGPWDHNVRYGIYVRPRWLSSPKVPCWAHRRRSLSPESCSCTSGTFRSVPRSFYLLIQHVHLSTGTILV